MVDHAMTMYLLQEKINYKYIAKCMNLIKEELIMTAMHPRRVARHLELGGEMDDF